MTNINFQLFTVSNSKPFAAPNSQLVLATTLHKCYRQFDNKE